MPPLVMARGHRIDEVSELPIVVSDGAESIQKTKQAVEMLKKLGFEDELQKVIDSKKIRTGKGKMRNRRYVQRRGPLVVYAEDNGIVRAMRNIPGVETASINALNILTLAPGGSFGRLLVWTEGAFKKLNAIYGSLKSGAPLKKGYTIPRAMMENADVARIINSDEVQSVLRPKLEAPKKLRSKKNPLKSKLAMAQLNPGSIQRRQKRANMAKKGTEEYKAAQEAKKARLTASKKYNKESKKGDDTYYKTLMKAFEAKAKKEDAEEAEAEEE